MSMQRRVGRHALFLVAFTVATAFGASTASAAELGDYLWDRRPLLVFAPADTDPRLAETLRRIEASRCDFVDRDMVLGVVA